MRIGDYFIRLKVKGVYKTGNLKKLLAVAMMRQSQSNDVAEVMAYPGCIKHLNIWYACMPAVLVSKSN